MATFTTKLTPTQFFCFASLRSVQVLKENDPMVIADLQKELRMCRDAANRWTDNIFACKSYLTKKRGLDKKEAIKMIGIGSAFDYPEDKIPK